MPRLSEALKSTNNLEGYAPAAAPPSVPIAAPTPVSTMEPGRNPMLRCPIPVLWQSTPDALRQFYLNGIVPQNRGMLPPAPVAIPTSTTITQNIQLTGTPVSGGSGSAPSGTSQNVSEAAVLTTPVLSPGNKFVGTVLLAKSFQLLSLSVQSPCRIQLYGTAAAQSSDVSRALDAAPAAGTAQNIICDVVLDTAPFKWSFQNRVGANADASQSATVYITVTNLDQSSDKETITIQYVALES